MIEVLPGIEGLLFDLDGTLIDTMPLHWISMHEVLALFGKRCEQVYLNQFAGKPIDVIVATINKDHGFSLDATTFKEEKARRFSARLSEAKPITPVVDIVHRYHTKLPMAVVSGGIGSDVYDTLRLHNMVHFFDTIITGDDPIPPKPSPEIFLEAARRIGVTPTACQVFEDAEAGIVAAHAAGMAVTDVRLFL